MRSKWWRGFANGEPGATLPAPSVTSATCHLPVNGEDLVAKRGLDRILRVREVQVTLARLDEAHSHEKLASEQALRDRIAALAADVAPAEQMAAAFSLKAAAVYRERLHQSAAAAHARVEQARQRAELAAERTRAARQDQSAIEKLIDKRAVQAVAREMRALENLPQPPRKRHGIC